jgi:hypothetical protein
VNKYWDPKINLGHVLIAFSFAGGALAWMFTGGSKLGAIEAQATQQGRVDERQDREVKEKFDALRADIQEVSRKLDRLIERQASR